MSDKDELSKQIGKLMEASSGTSDRWAALGKAFADEIHERANSPRLSGMEMLLLRVSTRNNNTETLTTLNKRYMDSCHWYAEQFGSDKLWTAVDPAYDKPEYRMRLQELGREVNVQNLFILMDERNAQLLP